MLAERELSPRRMQQLAINQKLADDTHAQADRLMATAAAQDKKAQELEAQGREADSKASYRQSRDEYNRAQNLYIKSSHLRPAQSAEDLSLPGALIFLRLISGAFNRKAP